MTSLKIEESSIPSLTGKVAVVTGGASGIGYATAKILAAHNAQVYILDLKPPKDSPIPSLITFKECNITVWADLSRNFLDIGHIDMVFANAGITENEPFLQDALPIDSDGTPLEPTYPVLDVNLKAVLNVIKLSWYIMKRQGEGGSIVLTASLAAYTYPAAHPLYGSLKAALIGLVRCLHPLTSSANITINAVAPAVAATSLVPQQFADFLVAEGLPISTADHVGLALVYSAIAKQSRHVEEYGQQQNEAEDGDESRWNGRVILTSGETYMEVEGPLAESRPVWLREGSRALSDIELAVANFVKTL